MARAKTNDRLKRLEQLAVQLKQDGLCTVKDLAQAHQVSERTIARDLILMREQGMPIDADRGRGGGVRLDSNWGVGRLNLSYAEAVDLLISIAVAEQMQSPIFMANMGAIRRQLVASFSAKKRQAVDGLKSRVLIGTTASTFVQNSLSPPPQRVVQTVHQAFIERSTVVLRYKDESGKSSSREIEPHYLLLNYPVWYIIAFDHLRDAPRTFRFDRILSATHGDARFQLLPKSHFQNALDGNAPLI